MHGPAIPVAGRQRKVYLVSLMDDASRLITHSAFCLGETALDIEGGSEEHTSELQSLMRISYAVFCLKKKTTNPKTTPTHPTPPPTTPHTTPSTTTTPPYPLPP